MCGSGRRSWCCLLLAGLQSIPREPLEAARVDGASGWYVLRRVTLPLLAPVLVVAILLRCLDAMKVFEYVFATTRGGPGTETETLQYFVYQTGIQFFRLGSASSMAFVVLLLVLTIIVIAFRRMEKAKRRERLDRTRRLPGRPAVGGGHLGAVPGGVDRPGKREDA